MNNNMQQMPPTPPAMTGAPNNIKDINSFLENMPDRMPFSIVEDHPNLVRDEETRAIINMDIDEYHNYKELKKIKDKEYARVESLENEMKDLKDDISEIKNLLLKALKGDN
jgi:phosphoenolpyruvate-protein kinase (PTS system EI component)